VAQKKVIKEEGLNATSHSFCWLRTRGPAGHPTLRRKLHPQPARSHGSLRIAVGKQGGDFMAQCTAALRRDGVMA